VTCAIVTCSRNELMATIHDRMPVILPLGARDRWLDPAADETELRKMLAPLPAEELEAYPVSPAAPSVDFAVYRWFKAARSVKDHL
jgi:putative SOS response-associated peptidase YedK